MDQTEKVSSENKAHSTGPLLDQKHGYYGSITALLSPKKIYDFCQDENNVKKVLTDLPMNLENFLDLILDHAEESGKDQYRIVWKNREGSKIGGTLTFLLKKAPANRGTIITSEANFKKIGFKEEGPSTLMNIFLKRMKMLMETGEIPTIKGQPNGREEISTDKDNKTLH